MIEWWEVEIANAHRFHRRVARRSWFIRTNSSTSSTSQPSSRLKPAFAVVEFERQSVAFLADNADDEPRKVFGDAFHFVTPNLHTGEEYTLTVTEGMPNEYFGKSFADDDSGESFGEGVTDAEQIADSDEDGKKMRGVLSFAPPPLDE